MRIKFKPTVDWIRNFRVLSAATGHFLCITEKVEICSIHFNDGDSDERLVVQMNAANGVWEKYLFIVKNSFNVIIQNFSN